VEKELIPDYKEQLQEFLRDKRAGEMPVMALEIKQAV
jgi:hypothetical protein